VLNIILYKWVFIGLVCGDWRGMAYEKYNRHKNSLNRIINTTLFLEDGHITKSYRKGRKYYDSETVSITQDTAKNTDHPGPPHKSYTVVITIHKASSSLISQNRNTQLTSN
jgi:hypothetical protein